MSAFLLVIGSTRLWAAAGSSPANASTAPVVNDPGQKGPYEAGFTFFVLTDPSRNTDIGGRPIAVYLWYPVDAKDVSAASPEAMYPIDPYYGPDYFSSSEWEPYGIDPAYHGVPSSSGRPFPVVLFSTGWTEPPWGYLYVGARLATHGFVVATIPHYGDYSDHAAIVAMHRPQDLSFVLSQLLFRNITPGDPLLNLLRPKQVAASGHSFGGYAAMTLAGGDDRVIDFFNDPDMIGWYGPPPAETDVALQPDPRFKVILPLDGSNQVLKFTELARVTVPAMGIGQEWNTLAQQFTDPTLPDYLAASWNARPHAAYSGHPAYRVDVNSAMHHHFASWCEFFAVGRDRGWFPEELYQMLLEWNSCNVAVPTAEIHRLTTKYMIAFLKSKLAGETGYQNILTPGYAISHEQNIEFFVTEKRNPNAVDTNLPGFYMYFAHQPGSLQEQAEKDPKHSFPIKRSELIKLLK